MTTVYSIDKDWVIIGIQALLGFMGVVLSIMVSKVGATLRRLEKADKELEEKIISHREDVLKNYITATDLTTVKDDIISRIDRFERTVVSLAAGRRATDGG